MHFQVFFSRKNFQEEEKGNIRSVHSNFPEAMIAQKHAAQIILVLTVQTWLTFPHLG